MLKIGDTVEVDTSIPFGWPDGIFNTGRREGMIIYRHRLYQEELGVLISGIECYPSSLETLVTKVFGPQQLEND